MPRVTSEYLKKLKNDNDNKVKGKTAPETAIDKAIKSYEAALAAAQKQTTVDTLSKMHAAIQGVETAMTTSRPTLKAKGFDDFGLRMQDRIKAALEEEKVIYKKMFDDHGADQKIAAEDTQEEKIYAAMLDVVNRKRPTADSAPSLALFTELEALVTKLNAQAEKCKGLGPFQSKKYTAQQQIIASIKKEITGKETTYKGALKKGVDDRKAVGPLLDALKLKLDKATNDLAAKDKLIATGVKLKDFAGVSRHKTDAAQIAKDAVAAYAQESSVYAPEAPLRKSVDLVAAKISQEDSATYIVPVSNTLFTAYKANSDLKRAIEAKAKEIAAIVPPVPPRPTTPAPNVPVKK